jgi:hypothetical protein
MLSYRVELYNREERGRIVGNGYMVCAVIDGCRAYTVGRYGSDEQAARRMASHRLTRREFDNVTKRDCKGKGMARDERDGYRAARMLPLYGSGAYGSTVKRDKLAERAAWRKRNPSLPTLSLCSPYRAPVECALLGRLPRVPLTREERAARGVL